ncbi:MAG: type II 3-dehydroquinate dehydratase, partial [Pseudomonadota bacterium]
MGVKLLVLNGPNLNLLGTREPEVYGSQTLDELNAHLVEFGAGLGFDVVCHQSNHEGELITAVQEAGAVGTPIAFNPGAYSHTSIGLRDAISGSGARVVEVHISNIHAHGCLRCALRQLSRLIRKSRR